MASHPVQPGCLGCIGEHRVDLTPCFGDDRPEWLSASQPQSPAACSAADGQVLTQLQEQCGADLTSPEYGPCASAFLGAHPVQPGCLGCLGEHTVDYMSCFVGGPQTSQPQSPAACTAADGQTLGEIPDQVRSAAVDGSSPLLSASLWLLFDFFDPRSAARIKPA
eukprot:SAG31_NODE_18845_length_620_cov_2.328215_1_plen_164_part_01